MLSLCSHRDDRPTQPTSAREIQIVWQDSLTMLVEILLTTL